jgi:exocyst complex protein 7
MIIDETREKLQKECKNLDLFKSLLTRSNRQTKEMCRILSQFDERLARIEETIAPVYEETGNLQKRQENIMKSIDKLDYVIKYYNVAKEVRSAIHSGPSGDTLLTYLNTMDKLKSTVGYFEQNNPHSTELPNVRRLYDEGIEWLLKEFRQLFSRYCKPHPPLRVFELVHDEENDDEQAGESKAKSHPTDQPFPDAIRQQLRQMAEWLCMNKRDDFVTLYSGIKSQLLEQSIRALREHERSMTVTGSGPLAYAHHHSPALMRKNMTARDSTSSNSKRTPKGIQHALKKKFQDVLLADIVTGKVHNAHSVAAEVKEEPPITEKEIVGHLTGVTALYKLMQIELKQMQGIVPMSHQKTIFSRLIASSIRQIVDEGESLANRVKKSTQRHDFSSSLNLFPILRHQAAMRHNFDLLFEGCASEVQNKFQGLVVVLQTTINATLEEFIEFIKNDLDTKVPQDGTVHELTSNIMIFIVQLLNYLDILSRVITVNDFVSIENNSDKNRIAFAQYINRVLAALGMTLNNKSQSYSDPYLKAIFMLNNYHYILKVSA